MRSWPQIVENLFRKLLFFGILFFTSSALFAAANITINNASTSNGTWSGGTTGPYIFTPNANTATIIRSDIQNRLLGTGGYTAADVTINTAGAGTQNGDVTFSTNLTAANTTNNQYTFTVNANGNITVSNAINLTASNANGTNNTPRKGIHVAFSAGGNIAINAAITTTGRVMGTAVGGTGGNITLTAGATGTITIAQALTANGANGSGGNNNGGNAGSISLTGPVGVAITNTLTANGGTRAGTGTGGNGGDITITGAGGIRFANNLTATATNGGTAGNFSFSTDNATVTTGGGVNDGQTAGVINGGALTKNGTGNLRLSGANTYSGLTTISTGTISLNNANALGNNANGTIITTGAVLDLNGINYTTSESLTVNGTGISNGGAVINSSATGATFAGLITLGSASNIIGGTGTINLSNPSNITGDFDLTLGGASGGTLTSNLLTNTGALTKVDGGTWTLSGNNSYTGATTITTGTLRLGGAERISNSSALIVNGTFDLAGFSETVGSLAGSGTVTSSAAGNPVLTVGTDNSNTSFSGIAQNGSATSVGITKNGTGILTLSGNSTYSGATVINNGTLSINTIANQGTSSAIGNGNTTPAISINATGVLHYTGSGHSSNRPILLITNHGGTIDASGSGTLNLSGGVSGNFDLVLTGTGNALQSGTIATGTAKLTKNGTGTWTLSGANTYTGVTTINSGVVSVSSLGLVANPSNLGQPINTTSGYLVLSGGTLRYTGANSTSNRGFTLSTGTTSTIDIATNNLTITGVSAATNGSLIKTGAGTLTLSGANAHTGSTTITQGELRLNPAANITPASQFVLNGGTLSTTNITATRIINNSSTLKLDNNSTLDLGTNGHTIRFAASNGVAWTADQVLTITGWAGGYDGTAGTTQRIYIGTTAAGLTSAQLSQIRFMLTNANGTFFFPATLLSTGELVPKKVNLTYQLSFSPGLIDVGESSIGTLSGSELGISYQLNDGTSNIGAPVQGTGGAISFAAVSPLVSTNYKVIALPSGIELRSTRAVIVNNDDLIIDLNPCAGQPGVNFFTNSEFGTTTDGNNWSQQPNQSNYPGVVYRNPLPGTYTSYTYPATPVVPGDDYYVIANSTAGMYRDPQQIPNIWLLAQDQDEPGTGFIYIVNSAFTPGDFYTEVLTNLCDSTKYEFSADIINLYDPSVVPNGTHSDTWFPFDAQFDRTSILPNVDFLINGKVALNTGNMMNDGNWHRVGFTFRTGGLSSITLTMRNNAPGGIGNDIALDNIVMRACGPEIELDILTSMPVCPGIPVTMTAQIIASDYHSPVYQWQRSTDGGNNWINIAGENGVTYTETNPVNGDQYRFITGETISSLTNPYCYVASNPVTIQTTADILTTTPGTRCTTGSLTLGATANSGSTINWYANATGGTSLQTGGSYTTPSLSTTTTYYVDATQSGCTSSPRVPVEAAVFPTAVAASVSISAFPGTNLCSGNEVVFTATPTNGGTSPLYQWRKNGVNITGATGASYTTNTLVNNDGITCVMTENPDNGCITGTPATATSNSLTMTVAAMVPSVSIAASPSNTTCVGSSVTFTATPTNGGAIPTYQWKLNGSNIPGETGSSYTSSSLANGDQISCVMTSSFVCASPTTATSNTITMVVNTLPTPTFTAQPGATAYVNNDVTYTTQAGQSNYTWVVPGTLGVDYSITSGSLATTSNTVTLKWLTAGSKTVTINYSNANGCSAATATSSTATNVIALPNVSFTTASQSASENSGSMTVTVQLSAISASDVTIPYIITGTASNGTDFTITPSPVTILAGNTTATITITIVDDVLPDGDESVILTIDNPTNATIGAIGAHIATITDNEPPLDSDGDGVADSTDLDDDNDGIPDIREILCLPRPFTNGSFDENDPPGNPNWALFDESVVDGWETTATDNNIEIWDSGFNGVPSYSGLYHAEINATQSSRLFQTLAVQPGDLLEWEIAHRGRSGVDQMFVYVGPVGNPSLNATVSTGNTAWVVYRGSYLVPAGVYNVELGFQSGTTASGNASIGNFIDFVSMFVVSSNACDFDNDGIPDKLDLDSDNDGIFDVVEAGGPDTDNNGIIDGFADSDGDGLANSVDDVGTGTGTALPQRDSDGDTSPDYFDTDADNDNCYDATEAGFTVNSGTGEILGTGYNANGTVAGSDGYTTGGTGLNSTNDRNSNTIYDFREAGSAVTLTVQPVDRTITAGNNTTFTVTASAVVYQWQVSTNGGLNWSNVTNGGVYSTATTNTLTITGGTYAMNGYLYRVVLSSPAYICDVDITSNSARLTVNQAGLVVSGLVFNDTNGTVSPEKVDGASISSVGGNPLYAVLVNVATNQVVQSTIVSSGAYSFSGSFSGLNLNVLLGITNYPAGTSAPTATLTSNWLYAGEIQNNAGNSVLGNDGTVDGSFSLGTVSASQAYINFGVAQLYATVSLSSSDNECPQLEASQGFNPENGINYNSGATQVVFTVERLGSTANWNFNYSVSGTGVVVEDLTPAPNSGTDQNGTFTGLSTNSIVLTFLITNVPGTQLTPIFTVTEISDSNGYVNTTDVSDDATIKAMPVVGSFN